MSPNIPSDNRALSSLNVCQNSIPKEQVLQLIAVTEAKEKMEIFCEIPFKDKTLTKLDVSGKGLGTEGFHVVSHYLKDNHTLLELNLSNTAKIGYDECLIFRESIRHNK
jgi:hypothetical protein